MAWVRRALHLGDPPLPAEERPPSAFEERMRQSRRASIERERARYTARTHTGNLLELIVQGGPYPRKEEPR
jgi:hypothetical protein